MNNVLRTIRSQWNKLSGPPHFWGLKICAVLFAVLVWFYVMETQNPMTEDSYTVPVDVRNLSTQLAIPDTTRQVTIRVQGSSTAMNELSSRQISAYCDFSEAAEGEVTLPVNVQLPEGVTLVSQLPESMTFTLEAVVSKSFPVEAHVQGQPGENYALLSTEDTVLDPAMVTLSGTQDNIDQVATVYVSADVTDLEENFSKSLSVEVLDGNGKNISNLFSINPSTVSVLVPVVYSQPEKSVSISPVYEGTPALGYRITRVVVEPSTVRAYGDLAELNELYYVTTAAVDVEGLKKTTSFTADLVHPNSITLSRETVTVVVQIESESTATVTKDLLYSEGLNESLTCTLPSRTFEIQLAGADTFISALSEGDVVPYVDLSNISETGSYTMPVSVKLPANVSLVSVSPATVNVVVTEAPEDGGTETETDPERNPEEGKE